MNPQVLTERFEMRLGQSDLDEVDAWRARQMDLPSRSEAVRRLMQQGLAAEGREKRDIKLGDGEKLILLMLSDLCKRLKVKSDMEPDFIEQVIYGGRFWALAWKYPGIFHGHEDSTAILHEVVEILDMWSFVEYGYGKLSKKDRDRVAAEAEPFGKHVEFSGFDGNNEAEYMGIAHFLVEQLDRFGKFKGREFNAHMPTIDAHRRMLAVFEPLRHKLAGRDLNAEEIIEIMKAKLHPSRRNFQT
jgi:uncharacterized protein